MSTAPTDPGAPVVIELDLAKIDTVQALRLPASIALRRKLLPFAVHAGAVWIAGSEHDSDASLASLERYFEHPLRLAVAEPASLNRALDGIYRHGSQHGLAVLGRYTERGRGADATEGESDATQLANEIIRSALLRQASDIHFDPGTAQLRIRFRVDGMLETAYHLPISVHAGLMNRFKIIAGLNIAERRAPQDGSFRHTDSGARSVVDVRVATLPTRHGERLTLRLLPVDGSRFNLSGLGMSQVHYGMFREAISKPHGLVLLTGPTGSGKSTTLYAAIRELIAGAARNVITIEDPIENEIPGIVQVEVDSADKVSFGTALRSVLRHDPDIVMIGEIRDRETADVAIKAALTGHLVFSTLHTNSAAGAVVRLAEMGVERFLIASTLRLAVAQRLVRHSCSHCLVPRKIAADEAALLGQPELEGQECREPAGCLYCAGRGHVGRMGLFEMLPVNEEWSKRIAAGAGEAELNQRLLEQGLPLLVTDAAEKLKVGQVAMNDIRQAVTIW